MRRFLVKVALFGLFVMVFGLSAFVVNYLWIDWTNIEDCEFPENQDYDLLILGSSNASDIARHYKTKRKDLKTAAFQTAGGGVLIQQSYLDLFFKKNNTTKKILYIFDTHLLFTDKFDSPSRARKLKFDSDVVAVYKDNLGPKWMFSQLAEYFNMGKWQLLDKFVSRELEQADYSKALQEVKEKEVIKWIKDMFGEFPAKADDEVINVQTEKMNSTIRKLLDYKSVDDVVLVIPPSLYGQKDPNKKETLTYLNKYRNKINFFDTSEIFLGGDLFKNFKDPVHLNQYGAEILERDYLSKYLKL